MMADYERAMASYEAALRHNPYSIDALSHIASLCRGREQFGKAIEYFKRILSIQDNNGDIWGALGHCYLMTDSLQEAHHAYQQALIQLESPQDPKLWYGIGILYDRYGSLEHAEEAFAAVMKMEPEFEKADEVCFRLGIIYKQRQKYEESLKCFRHILHHPPRPLTEIDIWFQMGHVYEQQKQYQAAKEAYERVLEENPDHAKVLQQLGWLYHQSNTPFTNQTRAIQYLSHSLKIDENDAQSWYLLGRCYMAEQNHNKAYDAYQQAVYRDSRNPTFWCSIGVLYYQINQYRDALDAYSRAIRLNPNISEVWYDLGTLYESCNNQIQDAMDAYQHAHELDPDNVHITQRLEMLRAHHGVQPSSMPVSTPVPQDVSNPYLYETMTSYPSYPPLTSQPYGGGTTHPSRRGPSAAPPNEAPSKHGDARMHPLPRDESRMPDRSMDRSLPMMDPHNHHPHAHPPPVSHHPYPSHQRSASHPHNTPIPPLQTPNTTSPSMTMHSVRSAKSLAGRPPLPSPPKTHMSPTVPPVSRPSSVSLPPAHPSYYGSPRAPPSTELPGYGSPDTPNEPLRRTSILYDQEKLGRRATPPAPELPKRRISDPVTSPASAKHADAGAADILMILSQNKSHNGKRSMDLVEADVEKRPRVAPGVGGGGGDSMLVDTPLPPNHADTRPHPIRSPVSPIASSTATADAAPLLTPAEVSSSS